MNTTIVKQEDGELLDTSDAFAVWFHECERRGLIPPNTRRVLIDITAEKIVTVYYEVHADEHMFTKDLMAMMQHGERVHVEKEAKAQCR
jgi:hypothetical protein